MRPRVFPAENPTATLLVASHRRFNEAAGIPRGKRGDGGLGGHAARGFNEAAGIPRGKPPMFLTIPFLHACFNEAAGIPRGKRTARNPLQLKTFTPGSRDVPRSPRTSGR